jgi:hypothetical protein
MEIAQGVKAADEGFFSFRQKAINTLLSNPTYQTMQHLRDSLVVKQTLSPYALFGKATQLTPPL